MAKRVRMQIDVPADTKRLIERRVAEGAFSDAGAFVDAAVQELCLGLTAAEAERLVDEAKGDGRKPRRLTRADLTGLRRAVEDVVQSAGDRGGRARRSA